MIFHSSFQNAYLWLPLIGLLVGLISTLIGGGGGGFFFIPVLVFLFGVPAHVAVTTSLAATLPVCLVGSIGCYRNGYVDLRLGLIMSAAGIPGAMAGALIGPKVIKSVRLEHVDGPIRFWFAISMILFGIVIIISAFTFSSSVKLP